MADIITAESKVTEVTKMRGVRLDGESMGEYGNFARALIAEAAGDHGKADECLAKAIAAQVARESGN